MSELFGAPSGDIAAQKLREDALKSNLDAQESLGRIALQPVEVQLKQAQTRLAGAEAGAKELATGQAAQEMQLEQDFVKDPQRQAQMTFAEKLERQGKIATTDDLQDGRVPTLPSEADYFEKFAAYARSRNAPPSMLTKITDKIATIREKEAIAAKDQAIAYQDEQKGKAEQAKRVSNVASAAAESPAAYMAIMGNPATSRLLPLKLLTGDYNADLPMLKAVAAAGQDSLTRMENLRKEADDVSKDKLRMAQKNKANADVVRQEEEFQWRKKDAEMKAKHEGPYAVGASEANQALEESRRVLSIKRHLEQYPAYPLDDKTLELGKAYTAPDGRVGVYSKNPSTGEMGLSFLPQYPRRPSGVSAPKGP